MPAVCPFISWAGRERGYSPRHPRFRLQPIAPATPVGRDFSLRELETPEQLLQKFGVFEMPQPADRFLLINREGLSASQGNHGRAQVRMMVESRARWGELREEKTSEESGLFESRPSAYIAMFTISPGG